MKRGWTLYAVLWLLLAGPISGQTNENGDVPAEDPVVRLGGFTLPARSYGLFGTAPRVNEDASSGNFLNYYARLSLWVGAVNGRGDTLVTSGDGNELTSRPEWAPIPRTWRADATTGLRDVKEVIRSEFHDMLRFKGHTPLGLKVSQQVYSLMDKGFAVLRFEVTRAEGSGELKDVHVGLMADVDVPDENNQVTPDDDRVSFLLSNAVPYIADGQASLSEGEFFAVVGLGDHPRTVSCWTRDQDPRDDAERYRLLNGETQHAPEGLGDYRFLVSNGPYQLGRGDTIVFCVAFVQARGLDNLRLATHDAGDFFKNALASKSLPKGARAAPAQSPMCGRAPDRFELYQNHPNPFNSETTISFDLAEKTHLTITIHDVSGRPVRTLFNGMKEAGRYIVRWDGRDHQGETVASGLYLCTMRAGQFLEQRKLLFLR